MRTSAIDLLAPEAGTAECGLAGLQLIVPFMSRPRRYRVWPLPTIHVRSFSETISSSHNHSFTTIGGAMDFNRRRAFE